MDRTFIPQQALPSDVEEDCAEENPGESRVPTLGLTGKPDFLSQNLQNPHLGGVHGAPKRGFGNDSQTHIDQERFDSRFSSGYNSMSIRSQDETVVENIIHKTNSMHIANDNYNRNTDSDKHTDNFNSAKAEPTLQSVDEGCYSFSELETSEEIEKVPYPKQEPPVRPQLTRELVQEALFEQDDDGDTQLHLAIIHMNQEVAFNITSLAQSHADLNAQNCLRQAPIHLATITTQAEVVRGLLVAGATVDSRDRHGNTALHHACGRGDMGCVQALTLPIMQVTSSDYHIPLQRIPQDPELKNYDGLTCLHVAAEAGHTEVIEHLLRPQVNAKIDAQDGLSGRTVLHRAVEAHREDMVQFLLEQCNADVDAKTFAGDTPLSIALGRGFKEMAQMLERYGANRDMVQIDDEEDEDEEMTDYCQAFDDMTIGGQPVSMG